MITTKKEIISNLRENAADSSNMKELISQRDAARDEMAMLADIVQNLIAENARIPQDQKEYNKKYKTAMERYETAKSKYEYLAAQVAEEHRKQRAVETFIKNVRELGVITEFDEMLWRLFVESVTVYSKNDIRVEFKK